MAECNECKYEHVISALQDEIKKNSEQHKEFYKNNEENLYKQGVSDTQQKQILDTLKDIKSDIAELKSKPGKRYDLILNTVAQWAILLVLGLLAVKWGI